MLDFLAVVNLVELLVHPVLLFCILILMIFVLQAETLLGYLREPRQEVPSSSPSGNA